MRYQGMNNLSNSKSSNLEFRKIKSLDFLYEINSNGTILRNVKSKKQLKIVLDMHHSVKGYYRSMCRFHGVTKRLMIHRLVAECWLGDCPEGLEVDHIDRNTHNNDYRNLRYVDGKVNIKKPVRVNNIYFESHRAGSKYIADQLGVDSESIRSRMKKKRKNILGFEIEYECRD